MKKTNNKGKYYLEFINKTNIDYDKAKYFREYADVV